MRSFARAVDAGAADVVALGWGSGCVGLALSAVAIADAAAMPSATHPKAKTRLTPWRIADRRLKSGALDTHRASS